MLQIPDAPWIADPERYADEYYGGCYTDELEEEENDPSLYDASGYLL